MTNNLEGYPGRVKGLLKTMIQVLLLTSYLQKPSCPWVTIPLASACAPIATPKFSLCWRTFESLCSQYRILQGDVCANSSWGIPCVCKSATRREAWSKGTGSVRGLQCWGRTCSGHRLGRPFFCNLSYSQIGFHPVPQRNGGELPQTCKRNRKNVKCSNAQLLHPGWCFFSRILRKNYVCQGLLSAPQKTK